MIKFKDFEDEEEDEEEVELENKINESRIKFRQYQTVQEDEDKEEGFKLTDLFLITFTRKLYEKKRELVLRGNDLYLRKGCRIEDKDLEIICDWLRQHLEVTAIDLSYNRITNIGLDILIAFLMETDHITRLNLMCNDIDSEGMKKLAEMKDNLTIHSLRVNGNKIGSEGGKELALLLDSNHHLQHLDLGDSDQSTTGLTYLLRVLQYSNSTLQFLDISRPIAIASGCGFDSEYTADLIGQMLQFNSSLKELVLQKMNLVDSDIEALMRGLSQNRTLLLLDLSCNELGDDGLTMLSDYLFTEPPMKALLLGHNRIRDLGLDSLSRALQRTRLQILDLAGNLFTDSGLQFFLNTIKKPYPLKALYIWGNQIGKKSARILRRMLYSGVLVQEMLDVIVYRVDHNLTVARNIADHYKHIYYSVGDYGFPQPVRIKPPCPDVIPTQRIVPRKSRFKSNVEKLPETDICPQATTVDTAPVPTKLVLDDLELKEELQMESEASLLQDGDSLRSANTLEMDKAMERMLQAPSVMISMRLEDEKQLRKESVLSSAEIINQQTDSHKASIESAKDCTWYTDEYPPVKVPSIQEEKIETTLEVSIQTSLEFDGEPRFSLPYIPYVPPYPIGMVSIIDEESKVPPEPSLFPEVKAAYVRKFQLPDEFAEEEIDLSDDPNYVLNREPLFPEPEEEPEPEPEVAEESIPESEPAAVSPYISSESEPGETISKYQILEKNIYGVEPTAPLPRDYEEALEKALRALKRDSERSLYQVIEECYTVIIQQSVTLAWRAFGRSILFWAVENAFDQVGVLRQEMGKEIIEEAITGVFESAIVSNDVLEYIIEKVFQEILADRESTAVAMINEATEIAVEKVRESIRILALSAINQAVDDAFDYLYTEKRFADLESIQEAVTKVFDESGSNLENMEVTEIAKMVVNEAVDKVFEELRENNNK